MTDKEYEKQKKRVKKFIDKWRSMMGLGWFTITYDHSRNKDNKDETGATTEYDKWMYKRIHIIFNMPLIATIGDKELENLIVHEFCHILTAPLANNMQLADSADDKYRNDLIEQTTESLANAFMWVYEDGCNIKLKKEKSHAKTTTRR